MIIGITGNIGSGKTAASAILEKLGFFVLNADTIGHELYGREDIRQRIAERFGEGVLSQGTIDRKKLKDIVFRNPKDLWSLNAIMHPEIIAEISKRAEAAQTDNIVIEGALLIEAGFHEYDRLVLITIDRETQMERVLKRGKYKREEVEAILATQMPQEEKMGYADVIIDNSGTPEELEKNVRRILSA